MSKTDLGEVPTPPSDELVALRQRIDAFNSFIQSLDGKPAERVIQLLGGASTVPLKTIKQLIELDVWPIIHRLINNEAHGRIIGCVINEDGSGQLKLSQLVNEINVRTIIFNATSVITDETTPVRPPGKQIVGPRPPSGGIDDMNDMSLGTREPLQF